MWQMNVKETYGGGKNVGWEKEIFFKSFAFPRKTCCGLRQTL